MTLRAAWAAWAPDGLAGGVTPSQPERGASRRRGGASGRLANAMLAHLPLAIAVIDADSRLAFWNERAAVLFGVPPMMAADAPSLITILAGIANLTFHQRDRIIAFAAAQIAAGDRVEPESWLRISLGRDRRITIQVRGIGAHRWMLVIDDVTISMASGRHGSVHSGGDAWLDPLTGLGNRRHFNQTLRTLADNAGPDSRHTVVMIDLDRFKPVNETLGRVVGDALLCLVAQRLRHETREEDLLVRLGGDEFVILLTHGERAEALAARVIEILSRPFLVEGKIAHIGASIGIACFPEHGPSADHLMRHAELALYHAKSAGGGVWRVFEPTAATEARVRQDLETDLRKALSLGELSVAYQPRFHVGTQALTGFAALPCWSHPTRGAVSPGQFIPMAEDIGCIVALGEFMLKTACEEAARWPPPLSVAVPVSTRQLSDGERLFDAIQSALHTSRLSPERLDLVIAETAWLAPEASALAILHRLRAVGVRIPMPGATSVERVDKTEQSVPVETGGFIGIQDDLAGRPIQAEEIEALLRRHGSHRITR
jgi:diguanylate cyclase (GGDEF)-like protein